MAKAKWLVEDGPFEDDTQSIVKEIESQGYECQTIEYTLKKLVHDRYFYKNIYNEDDCVLFYGSIQLARRIQLNTQWIPGPILDMENYDLLHLYGWYDHDYLLNADGRFMPWRQAYKETKIGDFIRPNGGDKKFAGQIITKQSDLDYIHTKVKPCDLVHLSPGKQMGKEYRLIICQEKIIASTQYRQNGELEPSISPNVPSFVYDYVNEFLEAHSPLFPDICFVIDVHVDKNKNCKIIEMNSVSTSGWYAAPLEPIIHNMSEVAEKKWSALYT